MGLRTFKSKLALFIAAKRAFDVVEQATKEHRMQELGKTLGHVFFPLLPVILGFALDQLQAAFSGSTDPRVAAVGALLGGIAAYLRTAPKDQPKP